MEQPDISHMLGGYVSLEIKSSIETDCEDPEFYGLDIHGDICFRPLDGPEDKVPIGSFGMYVLPRYGSWSLPTLLDATSSETAEFCQFLTPENDWTDAITKALRGHESTAALVIIMDRMRVNEGWRGRGIGLAAMSALIRAFGECGALVMCKPFPLFEGNKPEAEVRLAQRKLGKYWGRLGFRRVAGTQLMVMSTELKNPDIRTVLATMKA